MREMKANPVTASRGTGMPSAPPAPPPREVREFWTSRQRRGHSLHEISYRASFKPQLPEYFINRYTKPFDLVADPFLGRGTVPLCAHLGGRRGAGSDVNPLCVMLARPRFRPPYARDVSSRLKEALAAPYGEEPAGALSADLLAFYHPDTLSQLLSLRRWFSSRLRTGEFDYVDDWLRMVCLNRLSGHSPGFFSVRTLPPNLAVSGESQRRINKKTGQVPEVKDISYIVMKKSLSLLRSGYPDLGRLPLAPSPDPPMLNTARADDLFYLRDDSVDLVVTSPPFLDIVDYRKDNWLRCWFADIDADKVEISGYSSVEKWRSFVRKVLAELCRVLKKGGHIAWESGEVRNGEIKLDEETIRAAEGLPITPLSVLINSQRFTKTSNLWGVKNNTVGTNTNRVVLFRNSE